MKKLAQIKRQAVEHIDRYFSGAESPADLRAWALAHPTFANPKELDNSEDWVVSNALALMIALADTAADRSAAEQGLHEARGFLTGEAPFPEDRWPAGLLFRQR
ncbi:MAG: hypothetical protein HYZ72_04470 [Deltaproteobacteria bacterium]|nr:hypothetical protein [Deltaproteobacteria bacterium]